jgi:cytidylate kinase
MSTRVVCISRTAAAGGETIGWVVARRLGFRYVDEEIVEKAAQKAGVDASLVEAAEHRQPLIKRLIDVIALPEPFIDPLAFTSGVPMQVYYERGTAPPTGVPKIYRVLIREAIVELAAAGQAVIVAHAASMALGGSEGVLRVLVTASPETRARRLVTAGDARTEADAAASIRASDRERRNYFKSFYNIADELPTHYDLVVNTDVLSPGQAVSLILCAAGAES